MKKTVLLTVLIILIAITACSHKKNQAADIALTLQGINWENNNLDYINFDTILLSMSVMGSFYSEFSYYFNEDSLVVTNKSLNTYNIVEFENPVSWLRVEHYSNDSIQLIPLNEGAKELFGYFENLTFYNPEVIERYSYYVEKDSFCLSKINEAKRMIANDSMVVHIYTDYRFRIEKEFIELLKENGLLYKDMGMAPDHDVPRNCFRETMDYYLNKKYGEYFIDSLMKVADTLMLKNNLSNFIDSDFCDKRPYSSISRDGYSIDIEVDIPIRSKKITYPYSDNHVNIVMPEMHISFKIDSTGVVSDFQKGYFDYEADWNKQFEMELYQAAIDIIKNDSTWVPGIILNTKVNTTHEIRVKFELSKHIVSRQSALWTGMGTPENPYQISNPTKLQLLADNVDAGFKYEDTYFVITADLDLSGYKNRNGGAGWNPIGKYYSSFSGHIDGCGKKIKNLYINRPEENYIGLFGFTGFGSTIKNLCLENISVKGGDCVGGLVGHSESKITSCYTTGSVSGGSKVGGLAGGFVGYDDKVSIDSCYSTCAVTGLTDAIGGLVGLCGYGDTSGNGGSISNSYSTGKITGNGSYTGGLVGYSGGAKISSCYSRSTVMGYSFADPLVGYNYKGEIIDCQAFGHVPLVIAPNSKSLDVTK